MKRNIISNISKYTIASLLLFGGAASIAASTSNEENVAVSSQKSTRTFYDKYPEVKQVATTTSSTLAVVSKKGQDHLIGWGLNQNGNLTSGNNGELEANATYSYPVDITPDAWEGKEIKDVSISIQSGAAIIYDSETKQDSLWTWGANKNGLLANGTTDITENDLTPTEVTFEGTEDWELRDVELGDNHGMISVNDGTRDRIFSWGYNKYGVLGINDEHGINSDDGNTYTTPQEVNLLGFDDAISWTVEDIEIGKEDASAAVFNDGTNDRLFVWGHDSNFKFGINGGGAGYAYPREVDYGGTEVKEVEFSGGNMGVISSDGTYDTISISGASKHGQIPGFSGSYSKVLVPVFTTTDENETLSNLSIGSDYWHVVYSNGIESNLYGIGYDKNLSRLGIDYRDMAYEIMDGASFQYDEPQLIEFDEEVEIIDIQNYQMNTFIIAETNEFTKLFVIGKDETLLGISGRDKYDYSPVEMDFTYYAGVEKENFITTFGTFNFVTMIIMIIIFIILFIGIILLIFHKVHHKHHIAAIEEHGKTLLGEKDEK